MHHLLLLVGFFNLGICLPRQYHFIDNNKTWAEAQQYCKENYIDLASINNFEEQLAVTDITSTLKSRRTWVGLYDDLNSWKWSLEDEPFYNEGEKSFRNWYINKPQDLYGDNICAYFIGYNTVWDVAYCSSKLPFICFDGRANDSESYIFVNNYMNWTEAQKYCREHHTDLISVTNENENQKIGFLLSNSDNQYNNVWIGLYRNMSWSDKSNSSFSYWYPGQPFSYARGGYCTAVSMMNSGKWTAQNCSQAFPVLCYSLVESSRQYHFINKNNTWTEAQKYCRENFIDLATIDNMEEMSRLLTTVYKGYSGLAWIGLYDDVDSWRWSLDNETFYQNKDKDFRIWGHQPDNSDGQELCVLMDPAGKWFDKPCNFRISFVCYDGKRNKHVAIYMKMTWEEAQSYCRANYRDLASVRNETELQQIMNVTNGNEVWIGLYRNRLWSDQSKLRYTNWNPIQYVRERAYSEVKILPKLHLNQRCTSVDPTGKWIDEYCLARFPFICYSTFTPGAVMGLQLKIKVIRDPSLLEIGQMFLTKLKEELSKLDLPRNFVLNVRNIRQTSKSLEPSK